MLLTVSTFLGKIQLMDFAKKQGLKGLTAQVLKTNKPMMKVFEKSHCPPTHKRLENGLYKVIIEFNELAA